MRRNFAGKARRSLGRTVRRSHVAAEAARAPAPGTPDGGQHGGPPPPSSGTGLARRVLRQRRPDELRPRAGSTRASTSTGARARPSGVPLDDGGVQRAVDRPGRGPRQRRAHPHRARRRRCPALGERAAPGGRLEWRGGHPGQRHPAAERGSALRRSSRIPHGRRGSSLGSSLLDVRRSGGTGRAGVAAVPGSACGCARPVADRPDSDELDAGHDRVPLQRAEPGADRSGAGNDPAGASHRHPRTGARPRRAAPRRGPRHRARPSRVRPDAHSIRRGV